jgi:murein L,D-transpeptidase YcbB/YkuD
MAKRIVVMLTAIVFLGGCATLNKSTKDTQVKQLEAEIIELKTQLQQKDDRINTLQEELYSKHVKSSYKQEVYEDVRLTKRNIQLALQKANFYKGPIDGIIGPTSKKAIKDFQKANGLKEDGVVGKATWLKLMKYL